MTLYRAQLSVVILDAGTPRTISAIQSTHGTTLTATLSQATAGAELVFTLSELSTRLLLLTHTITPTSYVALRESQALRVDFGELGRELGALLRKASDEATYHAVLSLEETRFEIVQLSQFRLLSHVELELSHASPDQVLSTLASRARAADNAAMAADAARHAAETERTALAAELADARVQLGELQMLRDAAAQLDESRNAAQLARAEAESARAEAAAALRARAEAENAREAAVDALEAARASGEALSRDSDALRARAEALAPTRRALTDVSAQIRSANGTIERLRRELRAARERDRVRGAVMERQERATGTLEGRVANLERENRRLSDETALKSVEKDGVQKRLDAALRKMEEMQVVLASDRECIAFLNRELNAREMHSPTPPLAPPRRMRRNTPSPSPAGPRPTRDSAPTATPAERKRTDALVS